MNTESLVKSLSILAKDLDALGWDQPDRFYHVNGTAEDPFLQLAAVSGCPGGVELQHLFDHGVRLPEDSHGLVLTQEGLRHLTLEEVLAKAPEMIDHIKAAWTRDHGSEIPEQLVQTTVQNYYYDTVLPALPSADQMPEDMRKDIRIATLVLKDGTTIVSHHSKDADDHCTSIANEEAINEALIPGAIYMFINGLRPEADEIDDVRQAVQDMITIRAIENA